MPTYDLTCDACAHEFEVFRQGFLRDEDKSCAQCGASATQRITGFVTSRKARPVAVGASSGGGHAHGGGCGCGHNH